MDRIFSTTQVTNRTRRVNIVSRSRLTIRHGLRIRFSTVTDLTNNNRHNRQIFKDGQANRVHATMTNLSDRTANGQRVVVIFNSKSLDNVNLNTGQVVPAVVDSVNVTSRAEAHVVRTAVNVPCLQGKKRRVAALIVRHTQNRNPRNDANNNRTYRHRISPRLQQR